MQDHLIGIRPHVSTWVEDAQLERVHFATKLVAIGALRGARESCYFRGTHVTANYLVAFPRTALWIHQDRGRRFVADPTIATIYNRGQEHARAPISPAGDLVDWFALAEPCVRSAVATFDPRAADAASPLPFTRTAIPQSLYRQQRTVFVDAGDHQIDVGELEERAIGVFAATLACAFGTPGDDTIVRRERLELVERARAVIAESFAANLGVAEIAARCGVSAFHLCRSFREATGQTLHGFRRELRLRVALERLPDQRGDVSRLALDLGFSSHSHFSSAFQRHYGESPATWSARIA